MCVCVCLSGVGLIAASIDRHSSNRLAFVRKKILQCLTKQRQKDLEREKKEQIDLIYSIFPPTIARDLLSKKRDEEEFCDAAGSIRSLKRCRTRGTSYNTISWEFERTLARMHPQVS